MFSKEKMKRRDVPEMTVLNEMRRSDQEDRISDIKKDVASHFSFGKSKTIETE